jgi:NAD(P)H-flavin reductase
MSADLLGGADQRNRPSPTVAIIRQSWAAVVPYAEPLSQHFYGLWFHLAPPVRELFPVNIRIQRGRFLRALVHVIQMIDQPEQVEPFLAQLGRDHRKFGVLLEHYDALSTALIAALRHYSGPAWTDATEWAWADALGYVSRTMCRAAEQDPGPASWLATVINHRRLSLDVAVVTVQTGAPIPYRAGQYLSVETPRRPRLWRYFSPANAPREDGVIEFQVRAVPGGWVSQAIVAHTERGDTWRIGPPLGRLTSRRVTGRALLMVAGGTGLAPCRAVLDELSRGTDAPPTRLFFGGRHWPDLYEIDELRRTSAGLPWLEVIPVVEHAAPGGPDSGFEVGTLGEVVSRYGAWADHDVLVAGSPEMIRTTVSRMLAAGTPMDNIHYDPFTLD